MQAPDWFIKDDAGRTLSKRPRSKNDCVVRAYALALQIPFDESYDFWSGRVRKAHQGVDRASSRLIFKHQGWEWFSYPAVKGQKRMSHPRFCAEHPIGRYILQEAGHVSACIDGHVHDTHQPYEGRCIYGAWLAPDSVMPI